MNTSPQTLAVFSPFVLGVLLMPPSLVHLAFSLVFNLVQLGSTTVGFALSAAGRYLQGESINQSNNF